MVFAIIFASMTCFLALANAKEFVNPNKYRMQADKEDAEEPADLDGAEELADLDPRIIQLESHIDNVLQEARREDKVLENRLNRKIASVLSKTSWRCQTGNVSCDGDCGAADLAGGDDMPSKYVQVFDPWFATVPRVVMATNYAHLEHSGDWEFRDQAQDITIKGFTAIISQSDKIKSHGAAWIACGHTLV